MRGINYEALSPLGLGRITLMKSRRPGFWFQSRMNVTNVNIFSSLSLADMISLTSQDVCGTDRVSLVG